MPMGNNVSFNGGYYYDRLSENGKEVYEVLLFGIKSFSAEIILPFIPKNEISMIFDYVIKDNPLIFYTLSYNITSNMQKMECRINPDYIYSPRIVA